MSKQTTTSEVTTRKEYLDTAYADPTAHHRYYSQFVTPEVTQRVIDRIGGDRILASTDPHMNDIPLGLWDRIIPPVDWHGVYLAANGTAHHSLGDEVCISKTAARIWKETAAA